MESRSLALIIPLASIPFTNPCIKHDATQLVDWLVDYHRSLSAILGDIRRAPRQIFTRCYDLLFASKYPMSLYSLQNCHVISVGIKDNRVSILLMDRQGNH